MLGTSLTAGLGSTRTKPTPRYSNAKVDSAGFPITLVNAGLSGETSAGALRRAGWVLDQPAAAVVLEVGANDGLRGVDPDSTKANLVGLIGVVHRLQPTATVLLIQMEAPTNLGRDYTTRFQVAHDARPRCVDLDHATAAGAADHRGSPSGCAARRPVGAGTVAGWQRAGVCGRRRHLDRAGQRGRCAPAGGAPGNRVAAVVVARWRAYRVRVDAHGRRRCVCAGAGERSAHASHV
ncbi:MAG: hypothetical protein IPP90_20420 [Gemmatimonadaceae bacterium]|nr:hypothetical protein [Gemmatimonadaceae bacterium]